MNPTDNKIKNHGFIAPTITPDHYVLGVGLVDEVVLQPDGQWIEFLPKGEKQANDKLETFGCTTFATINIIEVFQKRLTGIEENYSDRFTYVTSETSPPGNDPHVVAEAIRHVGLVKESSLPFRGDITTLDAFRSLEGKDTQLMAEGESWLERFDFKHEWVFVGEISAEDRIKSMMEALTLSPLGVSVRAWQQRPDGLYFKRPGQPDTHWTACVVGYVKDQYWLVFDSYPSSDGSFIKKLTWDYPFGYCKRYHLAQKIQTVTPVSSNWFKKLIDSVINILYRPIRSLMRKYTTWQP